jgi:hypothetical protein
MIPYKLEQHAKRVPVTRNSPRTDVFMGKQMLDEEALQQWADHGGGLHFASPRLTYSRNAIAAVSRSAGVAVRYQYVSTGLTCPR